MNLPRADIRTGKWDTERCPCPRTLAEVLFPETKFAIVHLLPRVKNQPNFTGVDLLARLPVGWKLVTATGARKKGDYIIATDDVIKPFCSSPEERLAYGGMFFTSCWASKPQKVTLTVLVVEDGERGTGDCHGKASAGLWGMLNGDPLHAGQFRFASELGYLAKGTLVVADGDGYNLAEEGIDAVLPLSCFKSSTKPEIGLHTMPAVLGIVAWSEVRSTKSSWQVTQHFSWDAVQKDLLPKVDDIAKRLREAMTDIRSLVGLLRLDAKDFELPLLDVLLADKAGKLNLHPYIAWKVGEMLRKRWLDLALGGGMRFTGLMALPDDSLDLGVIATSDLPVGQYISTRYPLRYWGDLRIWENIGGVRECGVVYMSHQTAAIMGGDFDGDYFQFVSVENYPAMTEEILSWPSYRGLADIPKVKTRKRSDDNQINLANECLANAENKVATIALLIARAMASWQEELVVQLAVELQVAVDQFKFDIEHDEDYLESCAIALPKVEWVDNRKDPQVYKAYTLRTRGSQGTVGRLIGVVNDLWVPFEMASIPLDNFTNLFQPDKDLLPVGRALNVRYGRLVGEAMNIQDGDLRKEALANLFGWLKSFAETVEDKSAMLATVWNVAHNTTSETSKASLPFQMFPTEIAEWLSIFEQKQVISVVGLKHNAYANDLAQFDGGVMRIHFAVDKLGDKLRIAANVDGKRLGFVSYETPILPCVADMRLVKRGAVVYAAPLLQ